MNNIVITNSSEFQKIIDSLESSKNTIKIMKEEI